MRETPVQIKKLDFCKLTKDDIFNEEDERTKVCAGGISHGTTQGDSGGPLLVIRDHRWVQYGVTSYGTIYAIPGDTKAVRDLGQQSDGRFNGQSFTGIYTKVSAYCDWIKEKTNGEVMCQ